MSDALRSEQVTQWIKDLDSPDCREAAAARIVEKYTERLLQLIRGKLHKRFQGVLDSEDVAQSVWRCFFDGQFELANRSALLGLLTKIAVTRTQDAARRLDAAKRDRRREQPFVTESNVAKDGARVPKPLPARQRAKALPLPEEISVESLFRKSDLEYMTMGVDAGVAAMVIEMFESLPLDLQQVLAMDVEGYSEKRDRRKAGELRRADGAAEEGTNPKTIGAVSAGLTIRHFQQRLGCDVAKTHPRFAVSHFDPDALSLVDQMVSRFRNDWRAGSRPRMECIQGCPPSDENELFRAFLAAEIHERRQQGEDPRRKNTEIGSANTPTLSARSLPTRNVRWPTVRGENARLPAMPASGMRIPAAWRKARASGIGIVSLAASERALSALSTRPMTFSWIGPWR